MPSAKDSLALQTRSRKSGFLFLSTVFMLLFWVVTLCLTTQAAAAEKASKPNIIYILADDKYNTYTESTPSPLN